MYHAYGEDKNGNTVYVKEGSDLLWRETPNPKFKHGLAGAFSKEPQVVYTALSWQEQDEIIERKTKMALKREQSQHDLDVFRQVKPYDAQKQVMEAKSKVIGVELATQRQVVDATIYATHAQAEIRKVSAPPQAALPAAPPITATGGQKREQETKSLADRARGFANSVLFCHRWGLASQIPKLDKSFLSDLPPHMQAEVITLRDRLLADPAFVAEQKRTNSSG